MQSQEGKKNTKKSTETEVIEITDTLGIILWTKCSMEAQGFTIDTNLLFQDN